MDEVKKGILANFHAIPFFLGYSVIPVYNLLPGTWAVPLYIFLVIPVLDLLLGRHGTSYHGDDPPLLFNVLLWLWPFIQVSNLTLFFFQISVGGITGIQVLGHAFSLGLINGAVGITYSHELIHRKARVEQFLGEVLLSTVCYLHWRGEHVRGHHVHVATPADPASAPRGMTVYRFVPRSIIGSWQGLWKLERRRLERMGKPPWASGNYIWVSIGVPATLILLVWLAFGFVPVLAFLFQSLVAVILLEIVNYVEHYGLERRILKSGKYERPGPGISWNADNRLTNAFLINLQRHSDHHARPRVPYPLLDSKTEAPQLPFGYATMIIFSLIPPLFKRLVEPRIPST